VLLLIIIGSIIYYSKSIGVSTEGKGVERWGEIPPFTKICKQELSALKKDKSKVFKGHNP